MSDILKRPFTSVAAYMCSLQFTANSLALTLVF